MSRYCLDTSAYSFFMRGDPRAVALVDGADWLGMPSIVLGELETGFLLGSRREENQTRLHEFLDNPVVEELVVDHGVGQIYGELIFSLRRAGAPLPSNDVWIAAAAVRAGASVLTYDFHFEQIPRVSTLVLPIPE